MTGLDYLVIVLYGVLMLAVGQYYSRRARTKDDYLLGGRSMSPFMIGVSLFATLTSTLSYLAYPGEIVKNGPLILGGLVAFPVVMVIVGWVLIPVIMGQKVTSGYELLESRLGVTGRLLGSAMFVALRTIWMASIFYATSSTVLVTIFGLEPFWTPYLSIVMGVVTLIYTAEGGMRAVVMTDALQSLIMFVGAIVIIVVITIQLGGVGAWWPTRWTTNWPEPVFWFSPDVRVTFMGAFLNMLVWMTCTAGSDQMALQRYLATRDAAAARRSFGVHLTTEVLISLLLALVGLAVLGYFTTYPEEMGSGMSLVTNADHLLPHFILVGLPVVLKGLVIAALLSAAMSSLSSGMNSSCAVITTDFIGRFRKTLLTEAEQVRQARYVSVAVGIAALALSTVVGGLAENLLELCVKVVNLFTAPLFVLFFLALFVPWATPLGAVCATIAGVATAISIAFVTDFGFSFLWTNPGSFVAGAVVGMLVSLIPFGRRPDLRTVESDKEM